jgi:hypothetical protein
LALPCGEVLKALSALAPIEEIGVGDVGAQGGRDCGDPNAGSFDGLEGDDAVGLGEGKRVKEDGIDQREDGGRGADAKGKRGNRHDSERETLAELSDGKTKVLGKAGYESGHGGSLPPRRT